MLVRNASIPEAVPKVLVRNAVLLRVAKALSAISVVKIRERAKAPSCLEGSLSSSVPSAASAETLERVQNGRQADGSGGCGKSSRSVRRIAPFCSLHLRSPPGTSGFSCCSQPTVLTYVYSHSYSVQLPGGE